MNVPRSSKAKERANGCQSQLIDSFCYSLPVSAKTCVGSMSPIFVARPHPVRRPVPPQPAMHCKFSKSMQPILEHFSLFPRPMISSSHADPLLLGKKGSIVPFNRILSQKKKAAARSSRLAKLTYLRRRPTSIHKKSVRALAFITSCEARAPGGTEYPNGPSLRPSPHPLPPPPPP